MKHEIKDPSTTTEADRALRLRKDLADAQAKLREAEQWREQAAKAARLEREAATLRERVAELEAAAGRAGQVPRLKRALADAEARARDAEALRARASDAPRLERELAEMAGRIRELDAENERLRKRPSLRQLQEAEDRAQALEARLRERPAPTPRHAERCAQAKLNRRLFQENERLKQEARGDG